MRADMQPGAATSPLDDAEIYVPTEAADLLLRGGTNTLSAQDLALLIRFDGSLTVTEIRASLGEDAARGLTLAIGRFLRAGLLRWAEVDAFTLNLNEDLRNLAGCAGSNQAEAGLASLQRSGFFVQIARERHPGSRRESNMPPNVLLVEDDPMLARFTYTYLALNGLNVRLASNRAEIVAEIRRPPRPDLFLLDVRLPDVDGFQVLQRVREHPVLHDVPVIMLTGRATREAVIRGLAAGADGYVTKPFEPETLMRAIHTVLGGGQTPPAASSHAWINRDASQRRGNAPAM